MVEFRGRILPAELAVLTMEMGDDEKGVWMNSRGTTSGVVDLIDNPDSANTRYSTRRTALPQFVASKLCDIYRSANLKRGCPDLLLWHQNTESLRFVEVKNPNWDKPSSSQTKFIEIAKKCGVPTKIVEWEFEPVAT